MTNPVISGTCTTRFSQLKDEFAKNFADRDELGASVCVIVEGETEVDLYGGTKNSTPGDLWDPNTITRVFSCTKGAAALCLHLLADNDVLNFYADIRKYWPEFQKGYQRCMPVWMLLNHQLGLPALRGPVSRNELFDSEALAARLSTEPLFWKPGTSQGYHALTFGTMADEIVRRVTGDSIGQFFHREVAEPLGLDLWIGLPPNNNARVAATKLPAPKSEQESIAPDSIPALVKTNLAPFLLALDEPETWAAEFPAGGAFGNARSLAGMYAPLSMDGDHKGRRFISSSSISRMLQPTAAIGNDRTLGIPTAFAYGFAKSWGVGRMAPGTGYAIGANAFGHPGMGGSIGFADPSARLAFAYTMNRMNSSPSLDERAQSLIDATYEALGFADRHAGFWVQSPA